MKALSVLVLGASPNPARYSNTAVIRLREERHEVVAVGKRKGIVQDIEIQPDIPAQSSFHTITMYLNACNQVEWEEQILELSPKRIIFNPGAENPDLHKRAGEQGIEVLNACTLVMLASDQF